MGWPDSFLFQNFRCVRPSVSCLFRHGFGFEKTYFQARSLERPTFTLCKCISRALAKHNIMGEVRCKIRKANDIKRFTQLNLSKIDQRVLNMYNGPLEMVRAQKCACRVIGTANDTLKWFRHALVNIGGLPTRASPS